MRGMRILYKDRLIIENGREEYINKISNLLFETEDFPEVEWGTGDRDTLINRLRKIMMIEGSRVYYKNFRVIRNKDEVIGLTLAIRGERLKKSTFKGDRYLIKMQENIKDKVKFICGGIEYIFYEECKKNEYYLSNIIIDKNYRGKNYSQLLLKDTEERAKKYGYAYISLIANNENLVKYYTRYGFKRVSLESRRMIKDINKN